MKLSISIFNYDMDAAVRRRDIKGPRNTGCTSEVFRLNLDHSGV